MKKLTIFTLIIASIILIPRFSNAASSKNPITPSIINGVCGKGTPDNGVVAVGKPTENLCSYGTVITTGNGAPHIWTSNGHWTWICKGIGEGKDSPVCNTPILGNDFKNPNPKKPTPPKADFGNASSKKGGLVPACPVGGCGFNELMKLVNNVIKFLLVDIAVPLAAIVFAYAGFLLITAGDDPSKITKAKSILKNLLFGFIIALAAWLIVNTILTSLGFNGSFLTHLTH